MNLIPAFLKEKGFRYAIVGSLAWHLFWLFAVGVDFASKQGGQKPAPQIYFLGPVLSDDAFNELVAMKPEMSETYYKTPDDLAGAALEPELHNLDHQPAGDLVSVPTGQSSWNALRGVLRAESSSVPPVFYDKLPVDIIRSPFAVTGMLAKRDLFYLPELPREDLRSEAATALEEGVLSNEAVFDLTVNAEGRVIKAENQVSTGDPRVDLVWQRYLKGWQFMPSGPGAPDTQTGQVRVSGSEAR